MLTKRLAKMTAAIAGLTCSLSVLAGVIAARVAPRGLRGIAAALTSLAGGRSARNVECVLPGLSVMLACLAFTWMVYLGQLANFNMNY